MALRRIGITVAVALVGAGCVVARSPGELGEVEFVVVEGDGDPFSAPALVGDRFVVRADPTDLSSKRTSDDYRLDSSDPGVLATSGFGVFTAVAPGRTKLLARLDAPVEDGVVPELVPRLSAIVDARSVSVSAPTGIALSATCVNGTPTSAATLQFVPGIAMPWAPVAEVTGPEGQKRPAECDDATLGTDRVEITCSGRGFSGAIAVEPIDVPATLAWTLEGTRTESNGHVFGVFGVRVAGADCPIVRLPFVWEFEDAEGNWAEVEACRGELACRPPDATAWIAPGSFVVDRVHRARARFGAGGVTQDAEVAP